MAREADAILTEEVMKQLQQLSDGTSVQSTESDAAGTVVNAAQVCAPLQNCDVYLTYIPGCWL